MRSMLFEMDVFLSFSHVQKKKYGQNKNKIPLQRDDGSWTETENDKVYKFSCNLQSVHQMPSNLPFDGENHGYPCHGFRFILHNHNTPKK